MARSVSAQAGRQQETEDEMSDQKTIDRVAVGLAELEELEELIGGAE